MKGLTLLVTAAVIVFAPSGAQSATPSLQTTHTVVATIPTGSSAAGLAFATRSDLLYVANVFSDDVSVIDPRTRTVIDTVQLAGGHRLGHRRCHERGRPHDPGGVFAPGRRV